MKAFCRAASFASCVYILLTGCGSKNTSLSTPQSSSCNGATLSGTMRDSLTHQPITQGIAVLESGTELSLTRVYNFVPTQQVTTDVQGSFSMCAQSLAYPSVLVLQAMDINGKAYPPYVTAVTAAADLGIISMGGCTGICGVANEQQTGRPATITGVITSSPIAMAGTLIPQFTLYALDGSKTPSGIPNLWALAMPVFNTSPVLGFRTASGGCSGSVAFCSTYTFPVPAQSPFYPVSSGTMEQSAPPGYLIYAAPDPTSVCTPPYANTALQSDGKSFLQTREGAKLTAQTISFANCR